MTNIKKEESRVEIEKLVESFKTHIETYKQNTYNETQTRREFIDPFFRALGWDIDNKQNFSDTYKVVVHEDKVKVGKETKAPDYSFRIGGNRLFFVEAKRPSVKIKDEIEGAFQVRRYAWNAKLSLSILTDFEEFAIYDTTKKPNINDSAATSRVNYFTYEDYIKNFDFLWDTFSFESVQKDGLKKYANSVINKKGTSEVDVEFLKLLDELRKILAVDISKNNKDLSEDNINYAVQQTIDRIIFFRIAEDRNIEEYNTLGNACSTGEDYYKKILKIFKQADNRYNSGLFNFEKDNLSTRIIISDKVLKNEIVGRLYYPKCEYEFSIIPIEILGSAYEQFLGKVIRITPSHQAKIEYKEEVRKAGGVYYTPEYIVDYIIENTLGVMLRGKSVTEAKKIKILDPSCGSGSFLLGAYKYLLSWYKTQYSKTHKPGRGTKEDVFTPAGELTNKIKKEILINNIYGVDIDVNAVEVSKLSLLLKCLENETEATLKNTMDLFGERALPTLDENIVSGNSLIDIDFHEGELDFKELKKIKPFSFKTQFKHVFDEGGFDIIIGNPPYVKYERLGEALQNYAKKKYSHLGGSFDIFQLFLDKSYSMLKTNGLNGFIFPNVFLRGISYAKSREFFYRNSYIQIIRDYGDGVFEQAGVATMIFIYSKEKRKNRAINFYTKKEKKFKKIKVSQEKFFNSGFLYLTDIICQKIQNGFNHIEDFAEITRGLEIGKNKIIENKEGYVKILFGEDIERYYIRSNKYIRQATYKKFAKDENIFNKEKIIIREMSDKIMTVYDNSGLITNRSLYCIRSQIINVKYILAILNSKLMGYYYNNTFKADTSLSKIRIGQIKQFPIPRLDLDNKNQKAQHDQIVKLVDTLLETYKLLNEEKLDSNKRILQGKIEYAEKKIDEIVYNLYGLTDEEVKIVEGE